ncbi:MAG: ATP-binding protein [Rubrivivax sp.]
MAAANDRGPLTGPVATAGGGRRWRATWLSVIGLGLALALVAAALVQGRQAAILNHTVQSGDDAIVPTVYQAETEYLRLLNEWQRAAAGKFDRDALQLRYDVWVSRINLLHETRAGRVLGEQPEYRATMAMADAFIRRADELLGPEAQRPLTLDALAALEPDLRAMAEPIHGQSLRAAHHVGDQMARRNLTVRQHNQVGIALTVFLSALTLAFALLAWRQMRQLEQRRAALEDLAASLREARREAEAASEAKSVFLANMSHEIRTPFHGLMGMLSLLRETGLNPRQIDYLRTATESADHLLALLNDILDMSQLESGRMALMPAPVELRALLRDVESLMRPQAHAKQLALHVDTDPSVPERVLADPTRVKQVVFNLLSNAIKFSDRGAVVLDVRRREGSNGAPELEFVVSDTGIGMDEATLAGLFNRFMQADGSRSRRHGGTGLGLEISRNLARLMGGDITARSKPGEGSTFTFRMPLEPLEPAAVPAAAAQVERPVPARPLRVLVAEDHPVNRQYMAALLENLGHEAHFTANGEEAVLAMQHLHGAPPFDIVLMDLHMPVLDGVAATRAIRALPDRSAATVPIVALTADAFAETRDRCLVAGMNDFLTKPVSPAKLAASLRRLFGSAAGSPEEPPPETRAPAHPAGTTPAVDGRGGRRAAGDAARTAGGDGARLPRPGPADGAAAARRGARRQPLELRVNAHAARGAALNLGLAALAATAEALHEGASHLPAHEIARLVQRFEDLLPVTRQAAIAAGLDMPAAAVATG